MLHRDSIWGLVLKEESEDSMGIFKLKKKEFLNRLEIIVEPGRNFEVS